MSQSLDPELIKYLKEMRNDIERNMAQETIDNLSLLAGENLSKFDAAGIMFGLVLNEWKKECTDTKISE